MSRDVIVTYTYSNSEKSGEKTVVFHNCESSKAARDYAATVTARALDSNTELVLNVTCDEGWIQTVVVSSGEAHTLYRGSNGMHHRKIA